MYKSSSVADLLFLQQSLLEFDKKDVTSCESIRRLYLTRCPLGDVVDDAVHTGEVTVAEGVAGLSPHIVLWQQTCQRT